MPSLVLVVSLACFWVEFCISSDLLLSVAACLFSCWFFFPFAFTALPVSFFSRFWVLCLSLAYVALYLSAVPHIWSRWPLQNVVTVVSKAVQLKTEIHLGCFSQLARAYRILYIWFWKRHGKENNPNYKPQNLKSSFLSAQKTTLLIVI